MQTGKLLKLVKAKVDCSNSPVKPLREEHTFAGKIHYWVSTEKAVSGH